ncbi:MAG: DNA-protecting protein DprA [Acholeplasmatales bacterium]|jgi:hypothetical protein|nr:DNA-protecting protein DprA [Acholeplasmatales bacterium]
MNKSEITKLLCSNLCVGKYKPFTTLEFNKILIQLEKTNTPLELLIEVEKKDLPLVFYNPSYILKEKDLSFIERIWGLLQRQGSIIFDYMDLEKWGISIVTIFDEDYPKQLKEKLKDKTPVLLYYCGKLSILENNFIGFVGSRNINSDDERYTKEWIKQVKNNNYGVVSGGASGIDSVASFEAIKNDLYVVEFLCGAMIDRIKNKLINKSIYEGKTLLLSETLPYTKFEPGFAMARNKYIYSISSKTIVVVATYKKNEKGIKTGGTWNGAIENLNSKFPNTYVWNNLKYSANTELINDFGGIPINESKDKKSIDDIFSCKEEHIYTENNLDIDLSKMDLSKIDKIDLEQALMIEENINNIKTDIDLKKIDGISHTVKEFILSNNNNEKYFLSKDLLNIETRYIILNKFINLDIPSSVKNIGHINKIEDAKIITKKTNSIYPLLMLNIPAKLKKEILDLVLTISLFD